MNDIIRRITLDFTRKSDARVVFASQQDIGTRRFILELTDGGKPYFVDKSVVATVNVLRPDGNAEAFMASIRDDGTLMYIADMWALEIAGEVKCSVSLYDGQERKLTSASFIIDVCKSLYLGSNISEAANYSTLVSLMSEVNGLLNGAKVNAEAESGRVDAEWERVANENMRISAEKMREENELIRMSAEQQRESKVKEISDAIGNAEECLDRIIAIQNRLIGGVL